MRRPARQRARGRGFTLIEVVVALLIVVGGMGALLVALTTAGDSALFLRDKAFASWIGLNRISELRLAAKRPAEGKSSGEIEYAGRKWPYEQEVTRTQLDGVLRIDVRVRAPGTLPAPAISTAARSKNWTVTVSGLSGDAVMQPNGVDPDWNGEPFPGEPSGNPGGGGPGGDHEGEEPPPPGQPAPKPGANPRTT